MPTPPGPWPEEWLFQYANVLSITRALKTLAILTVEQNVNEIEMDTLQVRLRHIELYAGEIPNILTPLYKARDTSVRLPNWVLFAMEECPRKAREIIENVNVAADALWGENEQERCPCPSYKAARAALDLIWKAVQTIEELLTYGPPYGLVSQKGDEAQVRQIVETLNEKEG